MSMRVAVFDTKDCPYREEVLGFHTNCWKILDSNGKLTKCSEENCPLPALAERNSHISINDEDYDRGWKAGWNACLDAITRKIKK